MSSREFFVYKYYYGRDTFVYECLPLHQLPTSFCRPQPLLDLLCVFLINDEYVYKNNNVTRVMFKSYSVLFLVYVIVKIFGQQITTPTAQIFLAPSSVPLNSLILAWRVNYWGNF